MGRTYNGWTNYETWLVNLWMSNDEYSESAMRDAVRDGGYEGLKELVEDIVEEDIDNASGLVTDLVCAALCEVNWQEIAEHYTDDDGNSDDNEGDAE